MLVFVTSFAKADSLTSSSPFNLPEPTNNAAANSKFNQVIVSTFSLKFIFLIKTNGDSIPPTRIENIDEDDLRRLLESKIVYDKLTILGILKDDTESSRAYATKLHEIWENSANLSEKILTRLEILEAMRAYNDAIKVYERNIGGVGAAQQRAQVFGQNANNIAANAVALNEIADKAVDNI
ncbi:MAG: hypothetical protein WDN00_12600 [Limisphaerales bacterium]